MSNQNLTVVQYVAELADDAIGYEPIPEQLDIGFCRRLGEEMQEYDDQGRDQCGEPLYARSDLDQACKQVQAYWAE